MVNGRRYDFISTKLSLQGANVTVYKFIDNLQDCRCRDSFDVFKIVPGAAGAFLVADKFSGMLITARRGQPTDIGVAVAR